MMQIKHLWQQDSNHPDNASNLAAIQQWWASLASQEISWRQRLIPENGEIEQINWEPQRFDEVFLLNQPQLRGITLYWLKPATEGERNITPYKLELDTLAQHLYIYPQNQRGVIIRVGLPEIQYQTLQLKNAEIALGANLMLIRDKGQKIEIKVPLSSEALSRLRKQLSLIKE
uniref:Uncharacterized protein n=2 Tax=Desertifilaceae TaxID=1969992 RepID=A0A1E5QDA7_9CYAN|nr:hypothetical protein BH720_24265 [Desertifilum tharense IPPAS B-1220]